MRHTTLNDEQRELAALYALGSLDGEDARAFVSHLEEGCAACRSEVEALRAVSDELALATPPVNPRADLRDHLLARVRSDGREAAPFSFVREDEGTWIELGQGVQAKELFGGAWSRSYLLRCAPGARIAVHRHGKIEHAYLVSGDVHVAGRELKAGDYHVALPGTVHDDARTEGGCLLFIVEVPQAEGVPA